MPTFVIHEAGHSPRSYKFDAQKVFIGRDEDCDLVLPNVSVSRRHAMVMATGERHYITDLDSDNGLLVNGESKKHHELRTNDKVQIGKFRLDFIADDPAANLVGSVADQMPAYWVGSNVASGEQTMAVTSKDLRKFVEMIDVKSRAVVMDEEDPTKSWKPGTVTMVFGKEGVPVKGFGAGAELSWDGKAHVVKKVGWLSSLSVNGNPTDSHALKPGDRFQVGKSRFKYEMPK